MHKKILVVLLVPFLFLLVSLYTLSNYGINWDEPKHIIRGQSYLHFILTGNKDFCDLAEYPSFKGAPDYVDYNVTPPDCGQSRPKVIEPNRSYFQSDFYTFDYFMTKHEHTHPEVNDLLSAVTNYIFYQKLGVMGDIESHHLFIVLVTVALSFLLSLWVYKYYGFIPSIVATISFISYPLVFSESHFNIKDPVLMSFFSFALFFFWLGFSNKKYVLILLSAIFTGLALGTKFNVLFLPFILGPWALFDLYLHYDKKKSLISLIGGNKIILSIIAYPIISLGVLYTLSPYLWPDPVGHFIQILNYYKDIGSGTPPEQTKYIIGGWNTYPLVWILYTTPLPILTFSLIGMGYSVYLFLKKKNELSLLFLLWIFIPILRSVWPGTNIYGGVRQLMEFIPAMAILSGIGAYSILKIKTNFRPLIIVAILIAVLFPIWEIYKIHPNENVYFNQLAGGLRNAKENNIPSWGNTYGNVYLEGINWLNAHAEKDARLIIPLNYISSVPRLKLRKDISLDNNYFSGYLNKGEYAMEMSYDWPLKNKYRYSYFDKFLNPVHEVQVDGVPLLKIWKNDAKYIKEEYRNEDEVSFDDISSETNTDFKRLKLDFGKEISLTRIAIEHTSSDCETQQNGFISTSLNGVDWFREIDPLMDPEYPTIGSDKNLFLFYFPVRKLRYLLLDTQLVDPCVLKSYRVKAWAIK